MSDILMHYMNNNAYEDIYPKSKASLMSTQSDIDGATILENALTNLNNRSKTIIKTTITVTAPTGSTVTCTKGSTVLTATESSCTWVFYPNDYGVWTVSAVLGSKSASDTVNIEYVAEYAVTLVYVNIYGVEWTGTSATTLARTDNASNFSNPNPYVAGASSYGSPFDNLMPWSGMVTSTDWNAGGTVVAIPKFWYKLTQVGTAGVKIQISDGPASGFSVCPACMDRGDGIGERDVVYIGRYHCSSNNWKSQTGALPKTDVTIGDARTYIHNLGSTIWQIDFATRFTIWLLYVVEFADWDSQKCIGYGLGNKSRT